MNDAGKQIKNWFPYFDDYDLVKHEGDEYIFRSEIPWKRYRKFIKITNQKKVREALNDLAVASALFMDSHTFGPNPSSLEFLRFALRDNDKEGVVFGVHYTTEEIEGEVMYQFFEDSDSTAEEQNIVLDNLFDLLDRIGEDFTHFDLHAGNVIVQPDLTVRLIDFGRSFYKSKIGQEFSLYNRFTDPNIDKFRISASILAYMNPERLFEIPFIQDLLLQAMEEIRYSVVDPYEGDKEYVSKSGSKDYWSNTDTNPGYYEYMEMYALVNGFNDLFNIRKGADLSAYSKLESFFNVLGLVGETVLDFTPRERPKDNEALNRLTQLLVEFDLSGYEFVTDEKGTWFDIYPTDG